MQHSVHILIISNDNKEQPAYNNLFLNKKTMENLQCLYITTKIYPVAHK